MRGGLFGVLFDSLKEQGVFRYSREKQCGIGSLKTRHALKRLSILASFCQYHTYKVFVSIIAISRPSACLIEGSNGRLSPG